MVEADRGKHEDSRRHLSQESGRASHFPSPVRGATGSRREAAAPRWGWKRRSGFFVGWWKVRPSVCDTGQRRQYLCYYYLLLGEGFEYSSN